MALDFSNQKEKKLSITEKRRTKFIDIDAITHLQCDGYITIIYLNNNESIAVSKLLKLFENELTEHGFLRANNNTIINTRYITGIYSKSDGKVVEINNLQIKISRRRLFLFSNLIKNGNIS